jgi:hypothetical protein
MRTRELSTLIKASKGKNPHIFAHFEFKKKSDGQAFAQAQDEEDHLQGDEDDSLSSLSFVKLGRGSGLG